MTLVTAEEARDLLAAAAHHCACPNVPPGIPFPVCGAHKLVNDPERQHRLVFARHERARWLACEGLRNTERGAPFAV